MKATVFCSIGPVVDVEIEDHAAGVRLASCFAPGHRIDYAVSITGPAAEAPSKPARVRKRKPDPSADAPRTNAAAAPCKGLAHNPEVEHGPGAKGGRAAGWCQWCIKNVEPEVRRKVAIDLRLAAKNGAPVEPGTGATP